MKKINGLILILYLVTLCHLQTNTFAQNPAPGYRPKPFMGAYPKSSPAPKKINLDPQSYYPPAQPVAPPKASTQKVKNTTTKIANSKSNETKVWAGMEFIYTLGSFANYAPAFFPGFVAGISQTFYHINSENALYGSMVVDIANSSKTLTVANVPIQSLYYMTDAFFLIGLEHELGFYDLSVYGDAGLMVGQRAFIITSPSGALYNYNVFLNMGPAMNVGVHYIYPVNNKIGLLAKLNIGVSGGIPKNQSVYSGTQVVIDTVDVNPIMIAPSVSVGIRF